MASKIQLNILIFSIWLIISGSSQSIKNFSKCHVGKRFTHKNRAGFVKLLICSGTKNGVPQWQYTDGSSTLGEVFNPAKDCSDVVDHLPDAMDGFYWLVLKNGVHQVWCDLHTDGGGFMLVAMKDSPVSWTVPSNSSPVGPRGPPHWSSILGDVKVLDFRVQFSPDKGFARTKANWLYRLSPKRKFGSIFSVHDNGCPYLQAGIGNISIVKDLMTERVVTKNFTCSKFGPHTHKKLGWGRMNYCLQNECKNGYAIFSDVFKFRYDKFGSYSFSASSPYSGMNHAATAFVGCDQDQCCACFGPKGGRRNYCGPKCTAINGGTVIKKAFVWFWVRTRMPERLWKRCMEFTIKNAVGKNETYYVDRKTGTAHKGSCSEQFNVMLNEGTLSVSDKKSFERIPDIPGLLSYRKDNKQLYVNEGSRWQALSSEQEVHQLEKEVNKQRTTDNNQQNFIQGLENKIQTQENMIKKLEREYQGIVKNMLISSSCSLLKRKRPSKTSGRYHIYLDGLNASQLVQVYCDMTSKNGVGVTVVGHDSESRIFVKGYPQSPGSYKRKINYKISMEQIVAIIKQSKYCEQFIKYECYDNMFLSESYAWWVSRQGSKMNYWGGAAVNSGKCACGMTNSCANGKNCNCDNNDAVWRQDSGYLTDKNTLPVTELRLGDVDGTKYGSDYESGYHTLGKLRCWG